jgi:hypothetical protein
MTVVTTGLLPWRIPKEYEPNRAQIKQDLQAGLAYLREHGWCQGKAYDSDGRVCAITALSRPFRAQNSEWFDDLALVARFQVARRHLDGKIPQQSPDRIYTTEGYNDHKAKGQKDLEDLYEMAIADL